MAIEDAKQLFGTGQATTPPTSRGVIIAAKFKPVCPEQPEPTEIHAIRLAWEDAEDLAA